MRVRSSLLMVSLLVTPVVDVAAAPSPAARHAAAALSSDTLAWVGPRAITGLDLVQRIEWMPWPGKEGAARMDSTKLEALQSLAGEKLLALEAERRGLDRLPAGTRMRSALRRALARDALHRTLGTDARADAFVRRLLTRERVVVDSAGFFGLVGALRAIMLAQPDAAARGPHAMPGTAPDELLARLASQLDRPLATLSDGPLTLGDALEDLRVYPIEFRSLEPRPFAMELNTRLRTLVEGELLARAAVRQGLDQRPDVRHDVEVWSDAWAAQVLLGQLASGAPDPAAAVAREVAKLAGLHRVEFNYGALRRVDVARVNLVTKRFLGFGGAMMAAPSLTPMWDWVAGWRAQRTPLP